MDAHRLVPADAVPASRKLGRDDAVALAKKARAVVVAKGKKVDEFKVKGTPDDAVVDAMLGPTGNLRAPTILVGTTLVVGFNEDAYSKVLLG
jgi:arsenate reductase-like glutaredoxin family protein